MLLTGLVHAGLNGVVPLFRGVDPELSWLLRGVIAVLIGLVVVVVTGLHRRVGAAAD